MYIRNAEYILSKVDFSSYEDWETYPNSEYLCNCGQAITFSYRSLQKHSFSSFTNLKSADVLQIQSIADDRIRSETNSFLDFYCPGCNKPVRFYYLSWAGGRHGEYGYCIKFVVE